MDNFMQNIMGAKNSTVDMQILWKTAFKKIT